uniref:Uncharacterized protein n=1 Tax=Arundo donax TaxID=35708 RepID=A0A0A9GBT7_ARUDO
MVQCPPQLLRRNWPTTTPLPQLPCALADAIAYRRFPYCEPPTSAPAPPDPLVWPSHPPARPRLAEGSEDGAPVMVALSHGSGASAGRGRALGHFPTEQRSELATRSRRREEGLQPLPSSAAAINGSRVTCSEGT